MNLLSKILKLLGFSSNKKTAKEKADLFQHPLDFVISLAVYLFPVYQILFSIRCEFQFSHFQCKA
jgi:hypothetical protein